MIPIIEDTIIRTDKDIIVQQVNCSGFMGAGLAKVIMARYPEVRPEYMKFVSKLRAKGVAPDDMLGLVQFVDTSDDKIIANVFGQVGIRQGPYDRKVYTVEDKLLEGLAQVRDKAEILGLTVAIPTYIGCGLAGGDWGSLKPKIEALFEDSAVDVTFYHYRVEKGR